MNRQVSIDFKQAELSCCLNSKLLPIEQAIRKGVDLASTITETETISLSATHGRICHHDIRARLPLPNFDNSAMDGYAVNTSTLTGNGPYRLKITGRMAAGDTDLPAHGILPTGALRILTGAVVPAGYNAVIMQEFCHIEDGFISFDRHLRAGENIRRGGEDCNVDDLLMTAGTRLEARHISLLAAQGYDTVTVGRKVRVAIFSTGSELRMPGQSLKPGQIYNSNSFTLSSQLDLPYVEIIDLGSIKDDPGLLKEAMKKAVTHADLVITTGGVSVGDEDHMPDIITSLGGNLHVHKVAIKPGKPVVIATIGKTLFLGLPGNPVAAYLNQLLIGRAIIASLSGIKVYPLASYTAEAQFRCKSPDTFQEYVPVRITGRTDMGVPVVEAFKKSGSAALVTLSQSDGFVVVPIGVREVNPGDTLSFIPH